MNPTTIRGTITKTTGSTLELQERPGESFAISSYAEPRPTIPPVGATVDVDLDVTDKIQDIRLVRAPVVDEIPYRQARHQPGEPWPPTIYQALDGVEHILDWRDLVTNGVECAWETSPVWHQLDGRMAELLDALRGEAPDLDGIRIGVDELYHEFQEVGIAFAGLLGYGMARTWGENVEDLEQWLGRAVELADFDRYAWWRDARESEEETL